MKLNRGQIIAIVIAMGMTWFVISQFPSPIDEFKILTNGTTASGTITELWENPEDTDYGKTLWVHGLAYKFSANGQEYQKGNSGAGRLGDQYKIGDSIPVEYVKSNPKISRVAQSGSRSLMGVIGSAVFLVILWAVLVFPAVKMWKPGEA